MARNREFPDPWSDGDPAQSNASSPQTRPVAKKKKKPAPRRDGGSVPTAAMGDQPKSRSLLSRIPLVKNWVFWATLVTLTSGGLGFMAVLLLFQTPALPNCPRIFWPLASASLRLSCAQIAAAKQTVPDLLQAIDLLNGLPPDHPLREDINRYLTEWSEDILKLAEDSFQNGQLQEAIAIARRIPNTVPAHRLVEERVSRWQSIWQQAEDIYKQAEADVRQGEWNRAFDRAVRLYSVGNNYWATTRYQQLIELIQLAREESRKLDQAFQLARSGGLNNLLEAIKLAEAIPPKSLAYQEARKAIGEFGRKLLELAETALDQRNWGLVMEIANKIPAGLNLEIEAQDLTDLAQAQSQASRGTATDLEAAISLAQKLDSGRPLYDKAQQLILRWQREIEDVARLERARQMAGGGTMNELQAAITEANQIPSNNPRYQEAQSQVRQWTTQIETIQDQPYLSRAEQLASTGDLGSLQAAIAEASQVGRGRALYSEAQRKIGQWRSSVERIQDQPYLDQAMTLANSGNLPSAIAAANQIRPGRALSGEAQRRVRQWRETLERTEDQPYLNQADDYANQGNLSGAISAASQVRGGRALSGEALSRIRRWKRELDAQQTLQEALRQASPNTPEAIGNAIRTAQSVSGSSTTGSSAREAVNRWSYQLLSLAQERSQSDIPGAIAIAQRIPSGTAAYGEAQRQIQTWQQSLSPASLGN